MLNERGQATQQSLLTEPSTIQGSSVKAADVNAPGPHREVVTRLPNWIRDGMIKYAAEQMPRATWEEVHNLVLSVGLGALNGMHATDSASNAAPAAKAPEPSYPFDRKHIPAFKALCAAVESGPLTLDSVAVEAITGRMGSESLRGIGTFLAGLARKSPVMGLRVEALGRKPGRVTMDYRLSREGSTG